MVLSRNLWLPFPFHKRNMTHNEMRKSVYNCDDKWGRGGQGAVRKKNLFFTSERDNHIYIVHMAI